VREGRGKEGEGEGENLSSNSPAWLRHCP